MTYLNVGHLKVDEQLFQFIENEALPGTEVDAKQFWADFEQVIDDLSPINKALLVSREELQAEIHRFHQQHKGQFSLDEYKSFLREIGYLEPEPSDFQIEVSHVDDAIAMQAGPQLVVPVNNARYALNAVNARWGSLYDALYGTDVIGEDNGTERGEGYNPKRGELVISYGRAFLDQAVPLDQASHSEVAAYTVHDGQLGASLIDGRIATLQAANKFVGYVGENSSPSIILLQNNGLHIELHIDRQHTIGRSDMAGLKDIVLEAALTTIMDCEDSVAAVDAEDKVAVYRNWLGLMNGSLTADFMKGNELVHRVMHDDRTYCSASGDLLTLSGRSLLFVRNVGHLMASDAILTSSGEPIFEGIMDCVITSLIAKHDLLRSGKHRNSAAGSIYIVKPKMHGSDEAAFSNLLFDQVEDMLGLDRHTIKIGLMDEERRTSLNLKACIERVKRRVVFINTGFLDRTGDEMHTSMEAGPMLRKNDMKFSVWLRGYEQSNTSIGLACGLQGKAQIGKGMWAMPDLMKEMLAQKISQLEAGCSTAWVPSPTAAVLHALHYHQVDIREVQNKLKQQRMDYVDQILEIPVENEPSWTADEIQQELDNNAQGILGYVVRWVEQGIGCSKVPDINNVGLMEDRATLRISSQHMANWLHHGICSKEQIIETMKRMALVVDKQNERDPLYTPMAGRYEQSAAFQAALELVLSGYNQPNGYTEPILHHYRRQYKAASVMAQVNE